MDKKRLLFIIIFIVLIIGFGAMIYFVFLSDLISPEPVNENANANVNVSVNGLPVINGAANVNQITNVAVNAGVNITRPSNVNQVVISNTAQGGLTLAQPVAKGEIETARSVVSGDGVRFYDREDGKFYRLDEDGRRALSDQLFPEAQEVAWSPKSDKAVITYPDQSKVLYDFNKEEQITLPREWDDIQFSSSGEQIGFKNLSDKEDERWLAVAKPDGSEVKLVEPIGDKANDVAVNWSPNNQVMATYREGYSGSAQEIFLIGLYGENFKSLVTQGRGFEGMWSPDGDQLLYNVYSAESQYNPTLYLVDAQGDRIGANEINIGLQTWASKCTFANNEPSLYCAVPEYLPTGSGLYPSVAGSTNDRLYKIEVNTGKKSIIALPTFTTGDRDYSINTVFLSNDENTLYFIDGDTGELYEVGLL